MIAFYIAFHFWGLKPAIAASVACCVLETVLKRRRGERLSTLFIYSSAMTLTFGIVDLVSQNSFHFRYEATVTNLLTAAFFALSLKGGKSVIQDFNEKRKGAAETTPELTRYFRGLTCVWVGYFVAKAGAYAWIACNMGIEQALLVRTILGSASFYALLGISIFGSRRIIPVLRSRGWLNTSSPAVLSA